MVERYLDIVIGKLAGWQEAFIASLPNLAVALFVIVTFVLLGRLAADGVNRAVARVAETSALGRLAASMTKYGIIAVGFFVALEVLGLDKAVTSLLAGAGIVGLAIGIAFQDLAANFIAGVTMSVRKPFHVGDLIRTDTYFGFVRKMNMRNTFIETHEGQMVLVPNRLVFEKALVNYSYTGFRRIDFTLPVRFDADPDRVRQLAEGAVAELSFLAEDRPIEAFALGLGARGLELQVRYWIVYPGDQHYLDAIHQGMSAVRNALLANGIPLSYPVQTLDLGMAEHQRLPAPVTDS